VISATAQRDLSSFDLDYRGPQLRSVSVDNAPAAARRTAAKLVITPARPLAQGSQFTVTVRYAGVPHPVGNPDLGTYGWVPTRDGAVVLSEPDGASTWLPVNDHPSDKATYTFRVTVPSDLQVMANGTPDEPVTSGGLTTYVWHERAPMASYLATIAIGHFQVRRGMAGRIPVITAVDPQYGRAADHLYRTTVAVLKWEASKFGPYPFDSAGGIIDDPRLGYALETQERPVFAGFAPDDDFVVHELAHQWYGDSVSVSTWQDIWLNEGFATYAEWLWHERKGRDSAKKTFARYYRQPANSPIFYPPPARPGNGQLFSFSVYIRGAMCLQALRDRVGTSTFFRILRAWAAQHRYGNATTEQFEALAEQISQRRLGHLFDVWLNGRGKPKSW
jgi:aminopeptidase N